MSNLGWQRVALSADPDLLLTPAAWETTTIYYWYDYWYWWYGGYYGAYWGLLSPCLLEFLYHWYFSNGTDRSKDVLGANGNPITQWSGAGQWNMTDSFVLIATRMSTAIDNTFAMSPYLKTNYKKL